MADLLTYTQSLGLSPRRISTANGGEYASACPACGDGGKGKKSDRFHVWPSKENKGLCRGRFWCRQCGVNGDTIAFLQKFHNMTFTQACEELGIALKTKGRGRPGFQPSATLPDSGPGWRPTEYKTPSPLWQEKAAALLSDCREKLFSSDQALSWLAKRGITPEMAERYHLGFNESSKGGDRYRPLASWGLPEKKGKNGKKSKLWIPRGLVIPAYDDDQGIIQLRIRRLDEDIAAFAGNIKYFPISGSSMATMIINPAADVYAVVECGFDAILLAGVMDGKIGAVTTWNVSARPDKRAHRILSASSLILNGLDYDKAGENEQKWWNKTYPQNRRLKQPLPGVNDPGEAFEAGVDIKAWVVDSLPRGLQIKLGFTGMPRPATSPQEKPQEKEEKKENREDKARVIELTLTNGKIIYLTDDRAKWQELTDQKKPVFSKLELARLKQATSTMGEKERLDAAMMAIEIKETIGGYIRRGVTFDGWW